MANNDSGYIKKELPKNIGKLGIILFFVGAVAGIIGFFTDPGRTSYSYLVSFLFVLSISVGSLLLVAIEYAANAVWSTPFRRMSEFLAASLPLLILFVIPLLLNVQNLFTLVTLRCCSQRPYASGKIGLFKFSVLFGESSCNNFSMGIFLLLYYKKQPPTR